MKQLLSYRKGLELYILCGYHNLPDAVLPSFRHTFKLIIEEIIHRNVCISVMSR